MSGLNVNGAQPIDPPEGSRAAQNAERRAEAQAEKDAKPVPIVEKKDEEEGLMETLGKFSIAYKVAHRVEEMKKEDAARKDDKSDGNSLENLGKKSIAYRAARFFGFVE